MNGDESGAGWGESRTVILTLRNTVAMPAWVAIVLVALAVVAIVSLIGTVNGVSQLIREVRILQLHAQDIESALIRKNLAVRADFPDWEPGSPRHSNEPENKR